MFGSFGCAQFPTRNVTLEIFHEIENVSRWHAASTTAAVAAAAQANKTNRCKYLCNSIRMAHCCFCYYAFAGSESLFMCANGQTCNSEKEKERMNEWTKICSALSPFHIILNRIRKYENIFSLIHLRCELLTKECKCGNSRTLVVVVGGGGDVPMPQNFHSQEWKRERKRGARIKFGCQHHATE